MNWQEALSAHYFSSYFFIIAFLIFKGRLLPTTWEDCMMIQKSSQNVISWHLPMVLKKVYDYKAISGT